MKDVKDNAVIFIAQDGVICQQLEKNLSCYKFRLSPHLCVWASTTARKHVAGH